MSQIFIRNLKPKFIEKYKYDSDFKRFVKYIYLLAFVPPEDVIEKFQLICTLMKTEEPYIFFIDFFKKNFLYSNFPNKEIKYWNAFERVMNDFSYTTNNCEAYHKYLNTKINRKDRPLIQILDILRDEENRISAITANLKSGKLESRSKVAQVKRILSNYQHYEGLEYFEELEKRLNIFYKG